MNLPKEGLRLHLLMGLVVGGIAAIGGLFFVDHWYEVAGTFGVFFVIGFATSLFDTWI